MKKKRLGILTFHRAINYGAVLQCYALKTTCERFGFEVDTIDYNPFGHYTYRGMMRHKPSKAICKILTFRAMNRFVLQYLNPTPHTEDVPPEYNCFDIVVVGSDTIWHEPVVGRFIKSYLLGFIPKDADLKRIAYAASIGGEQSLSQKYHDLFVEGLKSFDAVSIREKQSVPCIQSTCDLPLVDVCDPSLLLGKNDYSMIEKSKKVPKHYIAVFDLAGDPEIKKVSLELKAKTGYMCINISSSPLKWVDKNYLGISPNEWLFLIHHADYICTNSFHGTCFSLVYERPFIFVPVRKGARADVNGRIENLLCNANLQERIYDGAGIHDNLIHLDYDTVRQSIDNYITRSKNWLESALS